MFNTEESLKRLDPKTLLKMLLDNPTLSVDPNTGYITKIGEIPYKEAYAALAAETQELLQKHSLETTISKKTTQGGTLELSLYNKIIVLDQTETDGTIHMGLPATFTETDQTPSTAYYAVRRPLSDSMDRIAAHHSDILPTDHLYEKGIYWLIDQILHW